MVPEGYLLIAFTQDSTEVSQQCGVPAEPFMFLGNVGGRAQCRVTDEETETWGGSQYHSPLSGIPEATVTFSFLMIPGREGDVWPWYCVQCAELGLLDSRQHPFNPCHRSRSQ